MAARAENTAAGNVGGLDRSASFLTCRIAVNLWLVLQIAGGLAFAARPQLDLTGGWDFYADVGDAGLESVTNKPGRIIVPGAWQAQGYGEPGGSIPSSVVGSDITPAAYLRHNLTARCLYVREVAAPAAWQGHRVFLCVRRAYRYTDVTVNGQQIGDYEGFSTPFEFDITRAIHFGQVNQLVIGVDNRPRSGADTVGMANYFINTGGLGGAVYIEARPQDWIQDVFAMPRIAASQAQLRVEIKTADSTWPEGMTLSAEVTPWRQPRESDALPAKAECPLPASAASEQTADLPVTLAPLRLWSPEDPFLYVATVRLLKDGRAVDEKQVRFGMREIVAKGNKLLLNGKPIFLSGYGDDSTYPVAGMLPSDKDTYLRQLRLMRRLGFNFVRHHSCIPHDEYFDAADEVGMLVQPEAAMAYVKYWPKAHDLFAKEWPNIVRAFRNHPSIWAWCMGNELFLNQLPERDTNSRTVALVSPVTNGPLKTAAVQDNGGYGPTGAFPRETHKQSTYFTRQDALELVESAYHQAKELDPTRLVHASDGGTPQPWTDVVSAGGWEKFGSKPYLQHEYGNYTCSLPDFSLVPRLNGVIRPLTYERAQSYVKEHGLEAVYPRLYQSSLAMRADAQKRYLEAARATGANAGYSFWLGIDFPESPEGCWDEGILNQFWEPKPGLTNGLSNITGPTVLLTTADIESRSFYSDEGKKAGLRVSHFGDQPLANARVVWRLREGKELLNSGELPGFSGALGEVKSAGEIIIPALNSEAPQFLSLDCELRQGSRSITKNAWEFYSYPRISPASTIPGAFSEAGPIPGATILNASAPLPPGVRLLVTRRLGRERYAELLRAGNASVLLLGPAGFKTLQAHSDYFLNAYGGAFGGIIEDHPVFASIPHQGRLHLGLYQLIAGCRLLDAEAMPAAFREGSVVWGLGLTAWISTEKNLRRSTLYCDVITDRGLHLVLCTLDILADKPESRYVLAKTLEYLLARSPSPLAKRCGAEDLKALLK